MNKKQGVLLIVVVLVAALGYWLMDREGKLAGDLTSPTPTPASSTKTASKSVAKVSPTPSVPYTQLVKEYEGRRIQFDQRCQVIPTSTTYKSGTSVMLDNRSTGQITVKVGDASYSLGSYGYRVVTLSSTALPKELPISCGSAGNVGKILLQATLNQ